MRTLFAALALALFAVAGAAHGQTLSSLPPVSSVPAGGRILVVVPGSKGSPVLAPIGSVVAAGAPIATTSAPGVVQPDGTTVYITSQGVISVPFGSGSAAGVVKPADGSVLFGPGGAISVTPASLGLAPSATIDTTNAGNISSGTLALAQIPSLLSLYDAAGAASSALSSAEAYSANAGNLSSGMLPAARLPAPTTSAFGGIEAVTCGAHQWIDAVPNSAAQPPCAQPSAGDVSGLAASATTDATNAANIASGTLAVARGGTGQGSYSDGQLLVGDSSTSGLDKATLTAGAGVSIANGHGSITIAATGSGGTVTSVALSMPSIFSVTGSPVTGSGTLAAALGREAPNTVLAPPCGSSGTPVFRPLCASDIPALSYLPLAGGTMTGPIGYGGLGAPLSAANGWQLQNTGRLQLGTAGGASQLLLNRTDATGTAAATLGYLTWQGANAAGSTVTFSQVQCIEQVITAGSEAGRCNFSLAQAGALTAYMRLDPGLLTLLAGTMLVSNGTAPTLSSCGTSPSDTNATDLAGTVMVGTGGTTTCALTWAATKPNKPTCNVTEEDGGTAPAYAPSTSGLAITFATSKSGINVDYECIGH